jgi:streptogramin lyase
MRRRKDTVRSTRRALTGGLESLERRELLAAYFNHSLSLGGAAGGLPVALADGPDGEIWFETLAGEPDQIHALVDEINPTTKVVSTIVDLGLTGWDSFSWETQSSMVLGPDGNMWLTDPISPAIDSINPTTDVLSRYPIESDAGGILAVGPDGNLWLADGGIGKFNPTTHVLTGYDVPNSYAYGVDSITSGPNGNLWFTVDGVDSAIGEINPTTDAITEFAAPTAGALPQQITAGPDGNLWFTELTDSGDRIGEINPTTGVTSDYAAPAGGYITTGPDGEVWFTNGYSAGSNNTSSGVGEIDTHSKIVTYIPSGNAQFTDFNVPAGIITGPDGNLWVADRDWLDEGFAVPANESAVVGDVSAYVSDEYDDTYFDPITNQMVYLDLNHDGTLDPGDPTAITDSTGRYVFNDLSPGTYTVGLVNYPGSQIMAPVGGSQSITVTAGELGTPAVFGVIGTSSAMPLTFNSTRFGTNNPDVQTAEVTGLYQIILGRAPDAPGLATWVKALKNGTLTLNQVATGFLDSSEYEAKLVASDYHNFLGRAGTTTEINEWVAVMQAGETPDQVAAGFFSSPEYSKLHQGNTAFIQTLYADVLGRQGSSSEVSSWVSALNSGLSRSAAVLAFVDSDESLTRFVDGLYSMFQPEYGLQTEQAQLWVSSILNGSTWVHAVATFASSPTYVLLASKTVSDG